MASAKLTARDVRRARDLAEWVLTESPKDGLDLDFARGEARHLLLALTPRRRPSRPPRAPGRMKPTSAQLDAETARLRVEALASAGGRGELCGTSLDVYLPSDLCHLDGGSGKRRQKQWIGNVVIEHRTCHQGPGGIDKRPDLWLGHIKAWCARYGYPLPERFRKLEALRSTGTGGEG